MANTSLFFRATEYQYVHGVDCQHKRSQITLDTIGNMTDSNDADTDADEHRVYGDSDLTVDEYEVDIDTDKYKID